MEQKIQKCNKYVQGVNQQNNDFYLLECHIIIYRHDT